MKPPILLAAAAGAALLALGACNRDENLVEDETAMSAEDGAVDAVAIDDDTGTNGAGIDGTSETGSARAPASATAGPASRGPTGSSTGSGAAEEALAAGPDRSSGATGAMVANPVDEQVALTRETLSPAGASSGPTAPRPQD